MKPNKCYALRCRSAQRETFCNTKPRAALDTIISIELNAQKGRQKRLGKTFTYAGENVVLHFWKLVKSKPADSKFNYEGCTATKYLIIGWLYLTKAMNSDSLKKWQLKGTRPCFEEVCRCDRSN